MSRLVGAIKAREVEQVSLVFSDVDQRAREIALGSHDSTCPRSCLSLGLGKLKLVDNIGANSFNNKYDNLKPTSQLVEPK